MHVENPMEFTKKKKKKDLIESICYIYQGDKTQVRNTKINCISMFWQQQILENKKFKNYTCYNSIKNHKYQGIKLRKDG